MRNWFVSVGSYETILQAEPFLTYICFVPFPVRSKKEIKDGLLAGCCETHILGVRVDMYSIPGVGVLCKRTRVLLVPFRG